MTRLHPTFACQGFKLAGTLDMAPGSTGLLIVSGGNEIRAGAFNGQARLAAHIAKAGFPVFRFDRRGVGDSDGENRTFRQSGRDIESALEAFRAVAPQMTRVVAFGNCDAASALMLTEGRGCDALVLSNPWVIDGDESEPSSEEVRSRYAGKLKDPHEVLRLLSGKVSPRKLLRGLVQALKPSPPPSSLLHDMQAGLGKFDGPVHFLVAERDRTAQAFERAWDPGDPRIARCPDATHAYVEAHAREWLAGELLAALRA